MLKHVTIFFNYESQQFYIVKIHVEWILVYHLGLKIKIKTKIELDVL